MKSHSGFIVAGVLAAALVLAGPAWAATGSVAPAGAMVVAEGPAPDASGAGDQPPAIRAMTDGEKQAAGCVISATGTMAATYAAGPSEIIMLVVGGLIVPSSSEVLFIGLMSTMASMACGAGAAITPAVLWAARQLGDSGQQAAAAGSRVFADLTGRQAQ